MEQNSTSTPEFDGASSSFTDPSTKTTQQDESASSSRTQSPLPAAISEGKERSVETAGSNNNCAAPLNQRPKSLRDRSRIPPSIFLAVGIILGFEYCCDMLKWETAQSWYSSFTTSVETTKQLLQDYQETLFAAFSASPQGSGDVTTTPDRREVVRATLVLVAILSTIHVLFVVPLTAGFWTGARAKKFTYHRYMGLFYLIQYFLAWVEFCTNFEQVAKFSVLGHMVALTGMYAVIPC